MERLRQRADFLAAAGGRKVPTAAFVLQSVKRGEGGPARIGFTVSRKVGTAVERNRVRRRLRHALEQAAADQLRPGHDYVLVGRRAALQVPFDRLIADLAGALRHLDMKDARPAAKRGAKPVSPEAR
jgi:ribonuclease P protein component